MPVVRVKSNGAWVEVDGVSNHAHPEYAPVDTLSELQVGVEELYDGVEELHDVLNQKSDMDHQHTASEVGALPIEGGAMEGTLILNGIVLTEGIDFGPDDPSGGVFGQLYFKKVT